ncbi:MAG: DUF4389 domain-containing protein [Candidatus Sungbacteria bacterium]|nr:DUF4389 domain-containing protein [Candidatus Sungbacteria bacterium]
MEPIINQSGEHPIKLEAVRPENSSRLLALLGIFFFLPKMVILVPHLIALWILGMISFLAGFIAQFAILFTGRYPESLWKLVLGTSRWQARTSGFMFGLTDKYPPFTLNK